MECNIDPKKINRDGILSLIKKDCVDCNLKVRMIKNIRCSDCPFISCSGERKSNKNCFTTGIACGAKFRQYGIDPNGKLGKAYLFFFLYHQEYKWYLPDGRVLHHKDGMNWNDHIWNLESCLVSIHSITEHNERKRKKLFNELSYKHLK